MASRTAWSSDSMLITTSHWKASASVSAFCAPLATNASAFWGVRFHTVTLCPALSRESAMPTPIWPRPITPTFMSVHRQNDLTAHVPVFEPILGLGRAG